MRASADVVVPFSGSREAFVELIARLSSLRLGPHDSLTVVDNTRNGIARTVPCPSLITLVAAPGRQSSYYARNRGAESGQGEWLVFLDADVQPVPELISRYLDEAPAPETGVLCGTVRDVPAT